MQRTYRQWAQRNNVKQMLPEDAEKRRNDTAVTPHLRADHSRRGFLIPYDDDLFRRDAAI